VQASDSKIQVITFKRVSSREQIQASVQVSELQEDIIQME